MGSAAEPTTDLARSMADRIMGTTSHAEALRTLRSAFPDSSLALAGRRPDGADAPRAG